ncbi:hypothetical protein Golob_004069 [Gossypium lobatum]|uniref:Uncharacterized protein n=2 Tax=Gossypium TaxID=3633 RepID=A0A7J8N0H1_9ROSI|nr:hypothetical protein [Gossypium lobatum]
MQGLSHDSLALVRYFSPFLPKDFSIPDYVNIVLEFPSLVDMEQFYFYGEPYRHLAILSHVGVEATRVLAEDFAKANHLETYSSVYEKAKFTMSCWLERLASGPSPRGPGH